METAEEQQRPPNGHDFGGHRIPWGPKDVLLGIGGFLAFFIIVPIIIIIPFTVAFGRESDGELAAFLVIGMFSQTAIAATAGALTFGKYGGGWERLGVHMPTWATFGWAVAALVGAVALGAAYIGLVSVFDLDFLKSECDDQIPRQILDNDRLLILAGFAAIAFAPICEELFFRGFIAPGLSRSWGAAIGIVGSGVLFALPHGTSSYKPLIPIFAIGLVFAYAYFRSGNILSTMLAHLAFNILAVSNLATCDPE